MEENKITINRATKWAIQGFLGGALFGFFMANKAEDSNDEYLKQQNCLNELFDSDDDNNNDSDDDGFFNHNYYDKDHFNKHSFKTISTSTSTSTSAFIVPTPSPIYKNKMLRKPTVFINTKKWMSLPFYQNAVLFDFKEVTHQNDKILALLRKNYSIFDISIQFMNKSKSLVLVRYRNQETQQDSLQNGLSLFRSNQPNGQDKKNKNVSVLYPTQILNNDHHHTILIIKKLPLDDFQETELKIRQSILHPMVQTVNIENNNDNNNDEGLDILNVYKNYYPYGYYQGDVTVIVRGKVINQGPESSIYLERYGNIYKCQYIPVPVTLALV